MPVKMRSIFLLIILVALMPGAADAQYYALMGDSTEIRINIPTRVVASFRQVFPIIPTDTLVQWEAYVLGHDYEYVATVGKQAAAFDSAGIIEQSFLQVAPHALPKPVQRRARRIIRKQGYQIGVAYAYGMEQRIWYYAIEIFDPLNPQIRRSLKITPDGNSYNPKFR